MRRMTSASRNREGSSRSRMPRRERPNRPGPGKERTGRADRGEFLHKDWVGSSAGPLAHRPLARLKRQHRMPEMVARMINVRHLHQPITVEEACMKMTLAGLLLPAMLAALSSASATAQIR